ncbi:MAG: hypothetical protein AB1505_10900 [Candidatus Latescibacterota bacterium]
MARLLSGLVCVVFACGPGGASTQGMGVGVRAGTLGLGPELAFQAEPRVNLRVGAYGMQYNRHRTESGNSYEVDFQLLAVAALADLHPLRNALRFSAGVVLSGGTVEGVARTQVRDAYAIGRGEYAVSEVGELTGDLDFNGVSPYLGVGWGNMATNRGGFGLLADLGVVFQGRPEVRLGTERQLASPEQQHELEVDLDREEAELQDRLDGFRYYPVAALGVRYSF